MKIKYSLNIFIFFLAFEAGNNRNHYFQEDQKNFEFHLKKTTILQDKKVSKRVRELNFIEIILIIFRYYL